MKTPQRGKDSSGSPAPRTELPNRQKPEIPPSLETFSEDVGKGEKAGHPLQQASKAAERQHREHQPRGKAAYPLQTTLKVCVIQHQGHHSHHEAKVFWDLGKSRVPRDTDIVLLCPRTSWEKGLSSFPEEVSEAPGSCQPLRRLTEMGQGHLLPYSLFSALKQYPAGCRNLLKD
ncbi:uncharacterized protein LOC143269599 [Peromyscus maniculatus bairdii]|uniref:uncharacterized protein LOC143269599 n=1 Tax=Peromyscus maniculatus bairdii TaxID=230844 RepID=UPI003FD29FB1